MSYFFTNSCNTNKSTNPFRIYWLHTHWHTFSQRKTKTVQHFIIIAHSYGSHTHTHILVKKACARYGLFASINHHPSPCINFRWSVKPAVVLTHTILPIYFNYWFEEPPRYQPQSFHSNNSFEQTTNTTASRRSIQTDITLREVIQL